MTKQKEKSLNTKEQPDKKEELFTLQVKQQLIEAIVDTGSQKNLISAGLVQRLGLKTTPHPRPYSLGWIQKDMDTHVNKQFEGNSQEGDHHRTKEKPKTEGKKIKHIRYGPFRILKKIDKNACQLKLPIQGLYMEMYPTVNVDKLKLFKPSRLDDKPLQSFPSLDKLGNEQKKMCSEAIIVRRKSWPTRRGERKSYHNGGKGQRPSASKWFSKEAGEAQFLHLQY
ncbi:putative reverse transcriptase domain-containing protein [Tanacetum coccineum]